MHCSYWAKKFWPFWSNVVAGFLKLRPTCPEEQWIEENAFNWIFILSSDIELKQWGPLAETFRQGCKNCNPSFKKTSPMKFVFCHCSPMKCWYWAKKSHFFWCKNFSRVFEAASYVSRGAMTWGEHFVLELFLLSLDIQI